MFDRRCFLKCVGALGVGLPALSVAGVPSGEPAEALELKARENLGKYGNCAQASFATLRDHLGLDDGQVLKALSFFPGGIALRGETCGVVVGSMMAFGLALEVDKKDPASFAVSVQKAREFCSRFEEKVGSTMCGAIQERGLGRRFNMTDPAEVAQFRAKAGDLCPGVVATGVRIAAEILGAETRPQAPA